MSKPVKSARGVSVDFDLLKIKQQIASAPKPTTVAARENFIDQRFKRRLKKIKQGIVDTSSPLPSDDQSDSDLEDV